MTFDDAGGHSDGRRAGRKIPDDGSTGTYDNPLADRSIWRRDRSDPEEGADADPDPAAEAARRPEMSERTIRVADLE